MQANAKRASDVGYGWTKFSVGEVEKGTTGGAVVKTDAFQSLPFAKQTIFDMGGLGKGPRLIDVNFLEDDYCVSDNPSIVAPASTTRIKGEKFVASREYGVCLAAAIKSMGVSSLDKLVLGTPVGNYVSAKKILEERFSECIEFDGRSVAIKKLQVVAQPIGGLVWHYFSTNSVKSISDTPRLLIDAGYGTLDWVVAHGLTPNVSESGSSSDGVSKFVDEVFLRLREGEKGISESAVLRNKIDRLITRDESLFYRGKTHERKEYEEVINKMADDAVQLVSSSIGDPSFLQSIVLMGGGARLFQRALHKSFGGIPVELIADARNANVCGFQIIAEHGSA